LKDAVQGKIPRNPLDPATVFAAVMQGGGFGIMGDYMFGSVNRFGQTPLESLAGPTLGNISDLLSLAGQIRGEVTDDAHAKMDTIERSAFRLVTSNTPFINMFYTRKVLDYVLLHSLQEGLNPGYLERSQRKLQQDTGQTYFLSPTHTLYSDLTGR
jgi:hypothetical protein